MSLLTENNRQYYEGAQGFRGDGSTVSFVTTFDTDLEWYSASSSDINYSKNNFKLYSSSNGLPGSWSEVVSGYTVSGNTITYSTAPVEDSIQSSLLTFGSAPDQIRISVPGLVSPPSRLRQPLCKQIFLSFTVQS